MRTPISRRAILQGIGGMAATAVMRRASSVTVEPPALVKPVPASGEKIPVLGMGTWITFNVAPFTDARQRRVEVLRAFLERGGRMVDSSPMYGLAEAAVGYCREKLGGAPTMLSATKVWTPARLAGIAQMNLSGRLWGVDRFDLMQVHNMVDWETHLETLQEWKQQGRIRYIGITTSHGRRHEEMQKVIESQPAFDFVQFSYSIGDREAEQRLLPAAAAHGKAVIINRPFRTGELFERVRDKPLPDGSAELGCHSWAQLFLKFVVSHPAVTCAIPATSSVNHMQDNMQALRGPLPDAAMRKRMAEYFQTL